MVSFRDSSLNIEIQKATKGSYVNLTTIID